MEITTEDMVFNSASGARVDAYAAALAGIEDAPGLVILHEAWGVSPHIRSVVDRFARAGFRAIAPNLFGMEMTITPEAFLAGYQLLNSFPPEERPLRITEAMEAVELPYREQFRELVGILGRGQTDEGIGTIAAAVGLLKGKGAPKVGVLGFCFGGGYVWAYAYAGGDADALVPFYGRLPRDGDPAKVKAPLLAQYGELDQGIPVPPLEAAAAAIRDHGVDATINVHEGAGHAFFNDTRATYDASAAALAWESTIEFLNRTLR